MINHFFVKNMSHYKDFLSVTHELHKHIQSLTVIRYTDKNRALLTHDYFWQQQNNFTALLSH